jgi:hypothetical protein
MKVKLKQIEIDIIFQYKIIILIDYVPENGGSVYSGEMTMRVLALKWFMGLT